MKQFNLEEYLANPSRKVVTRDRKAVKIHCTNYDSCQPIIAEIEGHNYSQSFTKDGKYFINRKDDKDLFFAPEKHEGWVNLLKDLNDNAFIGDPSIYKSKEDAEKAMKHFANYMASIKISWEE